MTIVLSKLNIRSLFIFFHDHSNYESHLFFDTLQEMKKKIVNFDVIIKNDEMFLNRSCGCFQYLIDKDF